MAAFHTMLSGSGSARAVSAVAMRWPDGSLVRWPDGSIMYWPS